MKFVLDTNVHIYFNLFTDCDWKTLLENDDLTLLVTPTILGEIDKLKNDPRVFLNRRARELGTKFDEIEEGKLTSSGIKLGFPERSVKDFDWNSYNLDKSRSDDNIIAEILMIKESCGDEICIVTEDSLLKRKARVHQIKFVPPPESWRRDQKDPKDKRIRELEELVKKTIPEVKLCLQDNGNCKENLEISIGTLASSTHTDRIFEEQMADLEKENIRKVKALREASCIELSYLRDVFSKDAYRFEEKSKKYLIDRYKEELNEYLINYKRVQEERISLMIIPLVLKSVGTIPAENIDVIVKFPQDIEPVRTLPEFPEEPKEEPKTSAELMESAFAISYPRLPVLSEPERRPVDEIFKGPMVDKSKNRVRYWIKSLKHGFNFRLPLYARFHKDRPAHTFHVEYILSISNHPKVTKDKLTIKVKQEEQS